MKVNEMKSALVEILSANLVPMIQGSPGIGKSDIVRSVAGQFKLKVIDMRLSQCDPTDMLGFPTHNGERMGYAPPENIPLQGLDTVPAGYNGWLLFLDEFNSAPLSVQAAAYKLVLDRMIGQHPIHKKCAIVCAGNRETDGAIVNRIGTAMQSRLIHLELETDVQAWLEWATEVDLDHRAISYVESRPDHLHKFDPNHNDKTFACPRTWEFAGKLIKNKPPTPLLQEMLIGTLSAGIAREFYAHMHYCANLPKIHEIAARPDDIPFSEEPALLYAVSHMVAAYITEKNADRLMRFIQRLPLEFGTTAIRGALKRNKALLQIPPVRSWAHKIAQDIF